MAALVVLVALPLSFVVLQAVFPHLGSGSLAAPLSHWYAAFGQDGIWALVRSSCLLGLGVAAVSAVLGIPLGALRGLFRLPAAPLWDLLFLVPFLLPPYIAALSWTMALQPRGYLFQLAGFDLGSLLFSYWGVVLVMGLSTFPVVYFAVSRGMAAAGGRLAEVARVCGASPWRAFVRVTLPLSLPAIAASLLLAFTMAVEEYGVPAALGHRAGLDVMTTAIERRLADWPIDLPGAALMSMVLVALALTVYTIQRVILRGQGFETVSGKPAMGAPAELGVWKPWVLALFTLVAGVAVIAPIAAMLLGALTRTISGGLTAGNFGLQHFQAVVQFGGDAWEALATSVGLATGAALLAGTVGFLSAWCVAGRRVKGAAMMDALSLMPLALPGVVVGVGLILAWNQPFWPMTPYGTNLILLLSYSCLLLPYPVRYVGAALAQLGGNLEAAARVHGASQARAMRRILLPLAMPSLVAAMLIVFAVASRELVTSLLLAPAGSQTVSIYIWRQFEQGSVGEGMAMAVIAVVVSMGLMLAGLSMQRRASST